MYLTHQNLNDYYVFDIEADSLTPTVIWCIVVKNVGTKETWEFTPENVKDFPLFVTSRGNRATWIGHNVLSFDAPVCNRLLNTSFSITQLVDSLVLGYLYHPKLPGGHSLEEWGARFNFPKGDFHDFTHYSVEMLEYCKRDVELTTMLFLELTRRMRAKGFSEKSCQLEHEIRYVVNKQQTNGFFFNIPGAESLLAELRQRQADLAEPIQRLFPPSLVPIKTLKYRETKNGSPHKSYSKNDARYPSITRDGGTYTVYDYKEFNIGSPQQRVEKLLSLGWKPDKFTEGGSPQADEEAVLRFLGRSEGHKAELAAMANWLVVNGRGNMIQTWLNSVNYTDSCMHGTVFTCGASTRRMTHSHPNTANIPKAKVKVQYGRECRSLWRARPGRVQVGYDAKALEMRTFCHYLGNPEVTKLYLEGDPHERNREAWAKNPWGYPVERGGPPGAKTGFYAGLYGAWDPKLGDSIVAGGGEEFGTWARGELYKITPGLQALIDSINQEHKYNDGFLRCVDGGFVRCPNPSAALNYLCQSAGVLAMKQAAIFLDKYIQTEGLDGLLVGSIHDEGQLDCKPEDAQRIGELACQSIKEAGEELNFTLPLAGDFKVGATWADTH